jgi:hypothetical protein
MDQGGMLFIGSEKPIEMDYNRLAKCLSEKQAMDDLGGIGIKTADDFLAKTFMMNEEETKGFADGASLNTVDKPIIEFSAPLSILISGDPDLRGEISQYKVGWNSALCASSEGFGS